MAYFSKGFHSQEFVNPKSDIFLVIKYSVAIYHSVSLYISSSSAISRALNLRSERTNVCTLSTLTSVCEQGLEINCQYLKRYLN